MNFPILGLWNEREKIVFFSKLNLKLRFKGTNLGLIWSGLEPLLIFSVLYIVFSTIRGSGQEEYFGIYLITGVMLFSLFSRGTGLGLACLRDNKPFLLSINIKKEFFPVSATVTTGMMLLIQLVVFFSLMPIFGFTPNWTLIFFPILLGLFLLLVLGLSYLLSIAFVFFKDVQQFWGVISFTTLFISPIFWNINSAPPILLSIQQINPIGQLIELGHKLVFGQIPSLNDWLHTSIIIFGILFFGYYLFNKFEHKISERI